MLSKLITECDLAIIPIPMDKPFWVGKPANKLFLLWRMGIPVLTSATPAYVAAMNQCGLDCACSTPQEWESKLAAYMADEGLRRSAGERGRAFAESEFGEERMLARWDALLDSLM